MSALDVIFWDVQHGNATYIRTPNNRHIVIDLGDGKYGDNKPFSPLLHLKNSWGIAQLDKVIITHPHPDHLDDIFNLPQLDPKSLHRPKWLSREAILADNQETDRPYIEEYLRISAGYDQPIPLGSANDEAAPTRWGGVKLATFVTSLCNSNNLNNQSIVTVLEFAGFKIIIPGDNEPESWKELIGDGKFVDAAKKPHVLLAPHHGRRSAYCPELFEAIGKTQLTVISDGPERDTSATGLYGGQSESWRVYYPDNSYDARYCVTTRKDGFVRVRAYYNGANNTEPRLNVFAQKGSGPSR